MVLTKQFKQTVMAKAQRDPAFRLALLTEAINEFLAGNVEITKRLLRDYINATVSFERLAKAVEKDPKSIQRMLSPKGNPSSYSLSQIISFLQKDEGVHLQVQVC